MAVQGKILVVANEKGGVSKTSLVTNQAVGVSRLLSANLHQPVRSLLVDNDPQAGASVSFGYEEIQPEQSMYQVYSSSIKVGMKPVSVLDIALPVSYSRDDGVTIDEGIDLAPAPADVAMETLVLELGGATARENILKNALRGVRSRYHYTFIDTNPSLGLYTINALTAADGVIIPVQTSKLGLRGLRYLLNTIVTVKEKLNPELQIIAVIPTMVKNNRKVSSSVLAYLQSEEIAELYPEIKGRVTRATMTYQEVYGKVQVDGMSVYTAQPNEDITKKELVSARSENDRIAEEVLKLCQSNL